MPQRLTLIYREPDGREFTHGSWDWMRQARREFERLVKEFPAREWTLIRPNGLKPATVLRSYKPTKGTP